MIIKFNQFILNEQYIDTEMNIGDVYDESDIYSYVQKLHRNDFDFWDGDIGERIEMFDKYKVALIQIDKIDTDTYELDEDYMDDYIEKYNRLGSYPPIILGYYDDRWGYDIIDGNHRANALKEAGLKSIVCFVGLNDKQPEVV